MRTPRIRLAATLAALSLPIVPATASAQADHLVRPGETLWSIAAANNLTTRTVAAYNGLAENSGVMAGSIVKVPTIAEGQTALARGGAALAGAVGSTALDGSGPPPQGAYTVRPSDTLLGLAAQEGVDARQIAFMNGLDPTAGLLTGTVLKLPSGAPAPAGSTAPAPAARVVPDASPNPTNERLDGSRVSSLASEHGVPGSLAAAIGWQESGFNNAMVSGANARGIMQILPGTWDWVQQNLAGSLVLSPNSAVDNVRAGALYLGRLLKETNGDPALAAAGYYQGLASVRRIGMLPETRQYVDDVLALRTRFGG